MSGGQPHAPWLHALVLQSESSLHFLSRAQRAHVGPPQSTSVSLSSFAPFEQVSPASISASPHCAASQLEASTLPPVPPASTPPPLPDAPASRAPSESPESEQVVSATPSA